MFLLGGGGDYQTGGQDSKFPFLKKMRLQEKEGKCEKGGVEIFTRKFRFFAKQSELFYFVMFRERI